MKFLLARPTQNLNVETLVVFVPQSEEPASTGRKSKTKPASPPSLSVEGLPGAVQLKLSECAEKKVFSATHNETCFLRDAQVPGTENLLMVGLGKATEVTTESLRQAAGLAYQSLKTNRITTASLDLDNLESLIEDMSRLGEALVQGFELASYSSNLFQSKEKAKDKALEKIEIIFSSPARSELEKGLKSGATIAECINLSRVLGDTPGNLMTPTILAEETKKAARGSTLKVTIWGRERIAREKMGSFLSVSRGSTQEPKFIVMEYKGAGKQKPLCLVGKGLTFDSGGISIKPSQGMEEMKYDMCGGANVIGAMLAIARLKLKVNVLGLVPATENMPGPAANKPGDIVTARNGLTIEVNNTDAEGRLILADALVYGSEQQPAMILDAATLTGAMVVALGNMHTGYFCQDEELNQLVQDAASASGEPVWRLPFGKDHLKDMKGSFADLSNISSGKGAGSATAAAFLNEFVEKGIPYAHFDIAGTAWHTGGRASYNPKKGASGVMVRTFVEVARQLQGR